MRGWRGCDRAGCLPAVGRQQRIQPPLDATDGGLQPFIRILRLVAALVDEDAGEHDEGEQPEELRLPVLERRPAPVAARPQSQT